MPEQTGGPTRLATGHALDRAGDVELSAHAIESPKGIVVEYTVRNRTDAPLAVLNRIVGTLPDGTVDPALRRAYVALDGRTLLVRAMRLPLPTRGGVQITGEIIPFVTRVAPGDSLTDRVALGAPIVVDDPYRHVELSAALTDPRREITASARREASTVALTVGVFRVVPPVALRPAGWPGANDVWSAYPPVFRQQLLSRDLTLAAAVPVLDYQAVERRD